MIRFLLCLPLAFALLTGEASAARGCYTVNQGLYGPCRVCFDTRNGQEGGWGRWRCSNGDWSDDAPRKRNKRTWR